MLEVSIPSDGGFAKHRRSDGTVFVNGSAPILGGRAVTVRCNFACDGPTFAEWIVN
jgi:hypothetical protein